MRFPPVRGMAALNAGRAKPHVTLITANGARLIHECSEPPKGQFVHAGRLWVFEQARSQHERQLLYCEMTPAIIADMRGKAAEVLALAEDFEKQLRQLDEQRPTLVKE